MAENLLDNQEISKFANMVKKSTEISRIIDVYRKVPVWPSFLQYEDKKNWKYIGFDENTYEQVYEKEIKGRTQELRYIPQIQEVTMQEKNVKDAAKLFYNIKTKAWENVLYTKRHFNQQDQDWGIWNKLTGDWTYLELRLQDPMKNPANNGVDIFDIEKMQVQYEYVDIRNQESFSKLKVPENGYEMVYNFETGNFEYLIGNKGRATFVPNKGIWDIKLNKDPKNKDAKTEACFSIYNPNVELEFNNDENRYENKKTPEQKAAEAAEKARKSEEKRKLAEENARRERQEREAEEKARKQREEEERRKREEEGIIGQGIAKIEESRRKKEKIVIDGSEDVVNKGTDYHQAEIAQSIQESILGAQAEPELEPKKENNKKNNTDIKNKSEEKDKNNKDKKAKENSKSNKPSLFERIKKWLKEFLFLNDVPELDEGLEAREERRRPIIDKIVINNARDTRSDNIPSRRDKTGRIVIDADTIIDNEKNSTETIITKLNRAFANAGRTLSGIGSSVKKNANKAKEKISEEGNKVKENTSKAMANFEKTKIIAQEKTNKITSKLSKIGKNIKNYANKTVKELIDELSMVKRRITGFSTRVHRYYAKDLKLRCASILLAGAMAFTATSALQRYGNRTPISGSNNNITFVDDDRNNGENNIIKPVEGNHNQEKPSQGDQNQNNQTQEGTVQGNQIMHGNQIKVPAYGDKVQEGQEQGETSQGNTSQGNQNQEKSKTGNLQNVQSSTIAEQSQTAQYEVKEGISYTGNSLGAGLTGTLSADTEVEIFNRAIVQTNEDGSTRLLLSSKGMTWQDFAKENGMSIEDIQRLLNNPNVKEMVAIQVAGAEHEILYVFGWTEASNLQGIMQNRNIQRNNISRASEMEH